MATRINSFDQFKKENGKSTADVTILSNEDKELILTVTRLSASKFLVFRQLAEGLETEGNEVKSDLSEQYDACVKMVSMAVVNDKDEKIFDSPEAYEYLKDNFPLDELAKVVQKVMELCKFTKGAQEQLEKN